MTEDLAAAAARLREDQAQVWRDALDLLVQLAGDLVGSEPSPEVLAVAEERSPDDLRHLDPLDVLTFLAGQSLGEGGLVRGGDDPVAAVAVTDWLVLVSLLVREGAGARVDAWVEELAEVATSSSLADVRAALAVLAPAWRDLGLLDGEDRLTATGLWVLPHALLGVWGDRVEELEGPVHPAVPLPDEDARRALDVLQAQPLSVEDLAAQAGLEDPDQLWEALRGRTEVHVLTDGRLLHAPTVLEGAVLTHRLTQAEVDLGVVGSGPDLGPWELLAEDGLPLVGGGEVVLRHRSHPDQDDLPVGAGAGLVGPSGWLDGAAAGELWGFRMVAGALEVGPVDAVADADLAERVVDLAARLSADLDPPGVLPHEVVLALLDEEPSALTTPRPPLGELLDDPRLSVHGSLVGPAGTTWVEALEWLAEEQHDAYAAWREAVAKAGVGEPVEDALVAPVAAGLAGGPASGLADLLAAEVSADPARTAPVVTVLRRLAPGATTTRFAALVAEATGDGAAWSALLAEAAEQDPGDVAVLADRGDLAALEGDAREAHRLYLAAGLDPQASEVLALRPVLEPPAGPGRNQPCPCGSGRKYKACHGRTDPHPPPVRGAWLLARFKTFLQRDLNREVLLDWAAVRLGEAEESADELEDVVGDPLTWDLAAFDGGVLARFLDLHGDRLPEDERALAGSWGSSARRLVEVLEVRVGIGVRLRDEVSGEELDVASRDLSQHVRRGDRLLGRLLDEGDGTLRFWDDPVAVDRYVHQPLLELLRDGGEAEAVAELMTPHRGSPLA